MGIDTSAVIVAGLPFGEFTDEDKRDELIDSGELDVISPYYDADLEHCVIGLTVYITGCHRPQVIESTLVSVHHERDFFKLTGDTPRLYISPLVI